MNPTALPVRSRMSRWVCSFAALGTAIAVLPTSIASAQEETAFLEEIVVVSQKREQTLQSLPVAVSVVSKQQLDESQAEVSAATGDEIAGHRSIPWS